MSKDIWHTGKEIPEDDRLIVVEHYSGSISVGSEFEYDLDRVRKWAYFDDLLALEIENKDLSDKIGKLETELDRTRKALDVAVDALKRIADAPIGYCMFAEEALEQITALEQKEVK